MCLRKAAAPTVRGYTRRCVCGRCARPPVRRKTIEVGEVGAADAMDFGNRRWCGATRQWQGSVRFRGRSRADLRRAADHEAVRPGMGEHRHGPLWRIDIAVGDHRDRDPGLYLGNGVVFRPAHVKVGAGAPVNGHQANAGRFGDAGDRRGVAVVAIPAGAELERDRRLRERRRPRPSRIRATRAFHAATPIRPRRCRPSWPGSPC